ncbi:hypothetical protein EP232_00060 [bacterium]|nr:MAG: hypothetical protein EP232_00060 [bacterium]
MQFVRMFGTILVKEEAMRKHLICLLSIALILGGVSMSHAYSYPPTDVRAMGMGGAYVAAGSGVASVNFNPALIRQSKKVEIVLPNLNLRFDDHAGLVDAIDAFNSTTNPLEQAAILNQISAAPGVDATAYAGIGVGFNLLGLGLAVTYADEINFSTDVDNFTLLPPDADVEYRGLEQQQWILTAGYDFGGLTLGGNVRLIDGTGLINTVAISDNPDIDLDTLRDGLEVSPDGTQTAFDLGIVFNLSSVFEIGVVGRNLNEPEFTFSTETLKLDARYRAGLALNFPVVKISADYDLNKAETFGGNEYQEWALGTEIGLGSVFALRLGLSENTAISSDPIIYHAGLGLGVPFFRFDLAGMYGGDGDFLGAGANLSFKF